MIVSFQPFCLWQYWKTSFPVSESEGTYLNAVAGRTIDDHARVMITALFEYVHESSFALTGVSMKTGFLEFLVPLLMLFGIFQAFRKGERLLVPLTAVQFCGLLLSSAGSRYLIFLLPGMYLFVASAFLDFSKLLCTKFRSLPEPRQMLLGFFALLAAMNFGHNIGVIWSAQTPTEQNGAASQRSLPFFNAARWLKTNAPNATVLTTTPRVIHYLSGCKTVSLIRSGVPEHEAWLYSDEQLRRLVLETKPDFLFADSKDAKYYLHVTKGVERLGFQLEEIRLPSSARHKLFKLVPAGVQPQPHGN
jgi:hypothetical protein